MYTSTINVVFAGEPIEDGDEASVSYVPPHLVSKKNWIKTGLWLLTTYGTKHIHGNVTISVCVCVLQHIDHYSRTKAIAEQMILSANGCSLKGVKRVSTDNIVTWKGCNFCKCVWKCVKTEAMVAMGTGVRNPKATVTQVKI